LETVSSRSATWRRNLFLVVGSAASVSLVWDEGFRPATRGADPPSPAHGNG